MKRLTVNRDQGKGGIIQCLYCTITWDNRVSTVILYLTTVDESMARIREANAEALVAMRTGGAEHRIIFGSD